MVEFLIAAFQRPGDAAMAQRALLEQKLKVAMMPTPRGVSVSCGLAIRFQLQDAEMVITTLRSLFPEPERCHFFKACKEQDHRKFYPVASAE